MRLYAKGGYDGAIVLDLTSMRFFWSKWKCSPVFLMDFYSCFNSEGDPGMAVIREGQNLPVKKAAFQSRNGQYAIYPQLLYNDMLPYLCEFISTLAFQKRVIYSHFSFHSKNIGPPVILQKCLFLL